MFAGNLKLDEDVKLAHQKAPVLPSHKKKKRNRKKKKRCQQSKYITQHRMLHQKYLIRMLKE